MISAPGNIKAVLSWHAARNAAKSVNNVSELAIIHVLRSASTQQRFAINIMTVALA